MKERPSLLLPWCLTHVRLTVIFIFYIKNGKKTKQNKKKTPDCQCRRQKRCESDPWVGKTPGGGHGNPLQDSFLEIPIDRGAWWATVHKVAESVMAEAI